MSPPHQFSGDFERLAAAAVASFNELLPVGRAVLLLPEPQPMPVRTFITGPAFVRGADIVVPVDGETEPVNIKRIQGGWSR